MPSYRESEWLINFNVIEYENNIENSEIRIKLFVLFADSLVGIGDIHVSAEYGLYRQDYMGIKRFCGK